MIKPSQRKALWRRIERYRDAMVDDSWKGGLQDLDERDEVEQEAQAAAAELIKYIDSLVEKK